MPTGEVIYLAELDSIVAKDDIGGCDVKKEIG
jgi:hypothetical protein